MEQVKSLGTELTDDTKRFMKTFSSKYVENIVFDRLQTRLKAAVTKALDDAKNNKSNDDDDKTNDDETTSDDKNDKDTESKNNDETTEETTTTTKVDANGRIDQPPEDESEPPSDPSNIPPPSDEQTEDNNNTEDNTEVNNDEENDNENENDVTTEANDDNGNEQDDGTDEKLEENGGNDDNDNNDEDDEMQPETPAAGSGPSNDNTDESEEKDTATTTTTTTTEDNNNDETGDNTENNNTEDKEDRVPLPTSDAIITAPSAGITVPSGTSPTDDEDTKLALGGDDATDPLQSKTNEEEADAAVDATEVKGDDTPVQDNDAKTEEEDVYVAPPTDNAPEPPTDNDVKRDVPNDDNDGDKKEEKEVENDGRGISHLLPIIDVTCEKTETETGPDGDDYTAYKLVFVKLNNDDSNPSRCGVKLSRYRKLSSFNDKFLKQLKESESIPNNKDIYDQLKTLFPGKTMFWKSNKDEKLISERKEKIAEYMQILSKDEVLCHDKKFQEFFGLKDDPDFEARMKVFHKSLLKACESDNVFPPSPWILARYDNENDQLICTVMSILKSKIDHKANVILGDTAGKMRKTLNKGISKTCGKSVSTGVSGYWKAVDASRDKIIEAVDKAIEGENGKKLDKVLDTAAGLAAPLIKKIFSKKDKKDDKDSSDNKDEDDTVETKTDENEDDKDNTQEEKDDSKDEEFDYTLRVLDVPMINTLKEELLNNLDGDWNSILETAHKKRLNMLINHFELERERHFEYNLKSLDYLPDFGNIEFHHRSRVCRSVVMLYRCIYKILQEVLFSYFEYINKNFSKDSDLTKFEFNNHCNQVTELLRKSGNIIATNISECETTVMNSVHGMTPTGGSKLSAKLQKSTLNCVTKLPQ